MTQRLFLVFAFLISFTALPSLAAGNAGTIQVKYHGEHSAFRERPFAEGDLSVSAYYDVFEGMGGWRIGAAYASDLGVKDSAAEGALTLDYVVTPEISLLIRDGGWQTGVGAMIDYTSGDGGSDWGDLYWQFQLGYNLPLGKKLEVGAHAFYAFKRFDKLLDFDFDSMDFAISVSYKW